MIIETEFFSDNVSRAKGMPEVSIDDSIGFRALLLASEIKERYINGENLVVHFPYTQESSVLIESDVYLSVIGSSVVESKITTDIPSFLISVPDANIWNNDESFRLFKDNQFINAIVTDHDTLIFVPSVSVSREVSR